MPVEFRGRLRRRLNRPKSESAWTGGEKEGRGKEEGDQEDEREKKERRGQERRGAGE